MFPEEKYDYEEGYDIDNTKDAEEVLKFLIFRVVGIFYFRGTFIDMRARGVSSVGWSMFGGNQINK